MYRGNRQIGGREQQRTTNLRIEGISIGWEWKWRRLKMAVSEINTWVFLETGSIEQIICQSRFGWRRIIQLIWCSSILSNNTMLCHTRLLSHYLNPVQCCLKMFIRLVTNWVKLMKSKACRAKSFLTIVPFDICKLFIVKSYDQNYPRIAKSDIS